MRYLTKLIYRLPLYDSKRLIAAKNYVPKLNIASEVLVSDEHLSSADIEKLAKNIYQFYNL